MQILDSGFTQVVSPLALGFYEMTGFTVAEKHIEVAFVFRIIRIFLPFLLLFFFGGGESSILPLLEGQCVSDYFLRARPV